MTKAFILSFLQEHKTELQSKFGIKKIGLFGSYAQDCATEESDIDLVIESDKKDFFLRDDLKTYLEQSFNKSVDIGYLDSFRNFYKKKIEQDIVYV